RPLEGGSVVRRRAIIVPVGVVVALLAVGIAQALMPDFGSQRDGLLLEQVSQRFGVKSALAASSTSSVSLAQAQADPTTLVTLAKGLTARVVTKTGGGDLDQIVLWPNASNPQYLIECNEEGTDAPGLQRITISDGTVATIVTGTTSCDPVRATPWGTVIF